MFLLSLFVFQLNSDLSVIGTIYNADFSNISVAQGEWSATTAAQLSVPAGTYIIIFFARTDSQELARYFLRVNGTIVGYIQPSTQNGQGTCGAHALTLGSAGTIIGTISGDKALNGWMGQLIAVRVK